MYWKIFLAPSFFKAVRAPPIFLMKAKVRCNFRQVRQSSAYSSYPPRLNFNQMVEHISSCPRCAKCISSLQTNDEVHLIISLFDLRRQSQSCITNSGGDLFFFAFGRLFGSKTMTVLFRRITSQEMWYA